MTQSEGVIVVETGISKNSNAALRSVPPVVLEYFFS